MNKHNAVFHVITGIAAKPMAQVHAVADAIGCPEWTTPEGCNRRGECFCATAARRVVEIERSARDVER